MEWTIAYLAQEQIVEVVTTGTISHDDMRKMIAAAVDAGIAHGSPLALVDHRQSDMALSVVDIYRLASFQIDTRVAYRSRVAIIVRDSLARSDEAQFFDDRSFNSGMARKLFADRDAAIRWLLEPTVTTGRSPLQ
jgi:hypothetical protein